MNRFTRLTALVAYAIGAARASAQQPEIPTMVRIAPGQFVAGSTGAETDAVHYPPDYAAREQPQRTVRVQRSFALGRTEITRGQFADFARATGWKPDGPCSVIADAPGSLWHPDPKADWRNPGFTQADTHPVVCVNLSDAEAYARWLSARTGRHFRLPSNDEWEYAARAGTATPVWWGEASNPCRYANLSDRRRARKQNGGDADPTKFFACDDGYVATAPVASFRANPWGLFDMIGNVWEWTAECLQDDCGSHIDRGSSWVNSPKYVRAAARHPDLVTARTSVLGFRLVEDLP